MNKLKSALSSVVILSTLVASVGCGNATVSNERSFKKGQASEGSENDSIAVELTEKDEKALDAAQSRVERQRIETGKALSNALKSCRRFKESATGLTDLSVRLIPELSGLYKLRSNENAQLALWKGELSHVTSIREFRASRMAYLQMIQGQLDSYLANLSGELTRLNKEMDTTNAQKDTVEKDLLLSLQSNVDNPSAETQLKIDEGRKERDRLDVVIATLMSNIASVSEAIKTKSTIQQKELTAAITALAKEIGELDTKLKALQFNLDPKSKTEFNRERNQTNADISKIEGRLAISTSLTAQPELCAKLLK